MNLEIDEFGQLYFEKVFDYNEKLSKLDYIELHQQLWNQIVKILIEKNVYYDNIDTLKKIALIESGQHIKLGKQPRAFCWACEYCNGRCKNCLLDWVNNSIDCRYHLDCFSLFSAYSYFTDGIANEDHNYAAQEAAVIRDLPLREE